MTLAEYGTSPWLFEPTDPAVSGHKTKEIKMSSENKSSQESIRANTDKMTKEARLNESRVKIGKNGRVVVEGRNPSVPSKDKGGK